MNLWIRSQNKETLIKSYEIYIAPYQNGYAIKAKRTNHLLGFYGTKERALEVLDEIQSILTPTINFIPIIKEDNRPEYIYKHYECKDYTNTIGQLDTYVYEMPNDDIKK